MRPRKPFVVLSNPAGEIAVATSGEHHMAPAGFRLRDRMLSARVAGNAEHPIGQIDATVAAQLKTSTSILFVTLSHDSNTVLGESLVPLENVA